MTETKTTNDKRHAIQLIERMSETSTFEEITEELAILSKLRQSEQEVAAGNYLTHEEIVERSAKWIGK